MAAENVALIALITNIVLALTTVVYASLTFGMARSAKRAADAGADSALAAHTSAQAAQRAAEANEASARAAIAALNIEMSVTPMQSRYFQLHGLEVRNTGQATVHVHDLELTYVLLGRLGTGTKPGPVPQPDVSVSPADETPTMLHRNKSASFSLNTPVGNHPSEDIVSFAGFVSYSIGGEPDSVRRYPFAQEAKPETPESKPRGSLGYFL